MAAIKPKNPKIIHRFIELFLGTKNKKRAENQPFLKLNPLQNLHCSHTLHHF